MISLSSKEDRGLTTHPLTASRPAGTFHIDDRLSQIRHFVVGERPPVGGKGQVDVVRPKGVVSVCVVGWYSAGVEAEGRAV